MGGISTYIKGRLGHSLRIDKNGEASVVVHPHPPRGETPHPIPYRNYFKDTSPTPSNDMAVDGSVTPVEFCIFSSQEKDIYIKSISVEIEDTGSMNLNKYGNVAALTNGVEFIHFTQAEGEYILHEGIQTNKEFIRLGVDTGAVGTGVDTYLADVGGGGAEKSYLPIINFDQSFGMKWGLKLSKGTTDRLIFRVNDDLSSLTTHNAIAYGIRFE